MVAIEHVTMSYIAILCPLTPYSILCFFWGIFQIVQPFVYDRERVFAFAQAFSNLYQLELIQVLPPGMNSPVTDGDNKRYLLPFLAS